MLLSEVTSAGTYEVSTACELQAFQSSEHGQINSQIQLRPGDSIIVDSVSRGVLSLRVQFAGTAHCINRLVSPNSNSVGSSVLVRPRSTD